MDRVAPDQGHQGLQVEKIQAKAKERRYLLSPVGRRIPIRSMYYALVFLEQGSEADVMKLARPSFTSTCAPAWAGAMPRTTRSWPMSTDERQIECRPGDR
jgi:hypothetical protein